MATPSSTNKPYIITIFLLTLVIIGGGIYFLFFCKNTTEYKPLTPDTADTTDDKDAETYTKDTLLGKLTCIKDQKPGADYCKIESSKIVNAAKGFTYTLTDNDEDLQKLAKIEIDKDDSSKATIKFDEKMVERYYGEKGLNFPIYLTFSREIASYKIASFGQGVGDEYIFFVMKDGSVGMVSVYTMLKDKNYNPYFVKGVKDITAIVSGSSYGEYGGSHTNYAVRDDKTAYDLQTLLPNVSSAE
ncbi:MAG: hypothetical protein Q4F58_03375 [Candidatus Saccharibacteria bacterium]|nr:hypothetical protein [Candidatus Saccharibacteria bacterium]